MATNDVDMDIEEKIEIEDDTPAPKQEPTKRERTKRERPKKRGGWLGKIVALFLGIIIGIAGGLGGVGGLAYYFATKKTIKQTADFVKSVSGFEVPLSTYLTDEYANKMFLDATKSAIDVAKKLADGTGTLNDVKAITPKIEDVVKGKTGLISFFSNLGITLNAEEVMQKKLLKPNTVKGEDTSYFTDYLVYELKSAPAGDVLKANKFTGNKLIDSMVYGEKGVDYDVNEKGEKIMKEGKKQLTVGELLGDGLMTRLRATPLDSIMDVKQSDTMMCAIAYGPKHRYVYDEATNTVTMQQMFYTFDGTKFFDDENNEVKATPTLNEDGTYTLTFEDESTQLVKLVDGKYLVFTAEGEPIKYKKTLYGDLEGNATGVIDRIALPSVLGVNGPNDEKSHAIMKSIAYDENGKERTLGMFKKDNQKIMDGIKLSTVLPVDTTSNVIMYMLYGKKDVHYFIDTADGNKVKPMQQRVAVLDGKVFNAYGELIAGAVANGTTDYTLDGVTYTLSADASLPEIKVKWTETVDETTTKHEAMAQTYFVSLDGAPLLYKENTIGTLKDGSTISKINDRLTLGDVVPTADGNKILNSVKHSTITDLPQEINSLTFDKVFGDDFYYRGKTTGGEVTINYHVKVIDNVETIVNKDGTIATGVVLCDKNGNEVSFAQKDLALAGSWKYILQTGKNTDGTPIIDRNIKLMDMGGIMDNMMKNVRLASVRELQEDGMIDDLGNLNNTKIMSKVKVPTTTAPYYTEKVITIKVGDNDVPADQLDGDASDDDYVGDLTIDQLLKYTSAVLSALTPTT